MLNFCILYFRRNNMICDKCNKVNKESAKFCEFCGASLNLQKEKKNSKQKVTKKYNVLKKVFYSFIGLILLMVLVVFIIKSSNFNLKTNKTLYVNKEIVTEIEDKNEIIETENVSDYVIIFSDEEYESFTINDSNFSIVENIDSTKIKSIYASTSLSEYNMTHSPERILDKDLSTAWVEGANGDGIGENIILLFDNIYTVNGFYINAGYQVNNDLYYKNSRPKEISVIFSDGNSEIFILDDIINIQNIQLSSPVNTNSLTIIINSVYPGSKYEDTAISEIELY